MKLIHWEYNKSIPGSITDIENGYIPNYVVHPDTKVKNGLYFKHRLRFMVGEQLKMNILAEKVFIADDNDVSKWGYKNVEDLINKSITEFNSLYQQKYFEATGLIGTSIIHEVKPFEVHQVLKLLHT